MRTGYLRECGWFESAYQGLPVDSKGEALPWFTYSAIDFLAPRITPDMVVFEYGSGNSTLWWSPRVKKVVSCEHKRVWYERLINRKPDNVDVLHFELRPGGDYCRAVAQFENAFHIVVIDGRDRVNCALNCLSALNPDGVVVWDDTHREKYTDGIRAFSKSGFKELEFTGLAPIGWRGSRTSIFYRKENCLGI